MELSDAIIRSTMNKDDKKLSKQEMKKMKQTRKQQ